MAKSQLDVLKEHFQSECKVINLKYEYEGYIGVEQWAVITELSEKELFEKYPDIISRCIPFVLLSVEQGKCDKCDNMGWDYIIYERRTSTGDKGYRNNE